jgi:hypothetical protein
LAFLATLWTIIPAQAELERGTLPGDFKMRCLGSPNFRLYSCFPVAFPSRLFA